METAKYFAVMNYACEYNNGAPVVFIAETKEDILRKMNDFTESLFSESFYTIEDLSEEGRLYMDCVLDYISDDFAFCTDRPDVFEEVLNNLYSYTSELENKQDEKY